MQVRDIESSDGECFDEQGHAGRRHQSVPATGRRQQNAIVALPAYQQNPQASPTWGNAEDESNQLMDEHVLEAKLKAIAQAQLVYSQQALKAVKDACSELIRQKDSTIAQLQLEVQRLQNNRQHSAGGHNSGGTGESPGYTSSRVSEALKKPQVAWHLDEKVSGLRDVANVNVAAYNSGPRAPSANVVEFPRGDAPKMVHPQPAVEATVVQVEKKSSVQMSRSGTMITEPSRDSRYSAGTAGTVQSGRGTTKRGSVASSAKKARQDAKSKGTSEEQQKAIQDGGQGVFIDAAAMKERVKEAIMRPEYNVMNYYKKSGCWQWIARNPWFENFTLCVIAFNALWIAIDTDRNKAPTLIVAHPVFIVAENFFCIYFTGELLIRFMAFKNKRDCLRDAWFVFDSCLVLMLVLDTWVMSAVLIITNKGSGAGLGDTPLETLYFASVPSAMRSLLLHGVLPDLHEFVNKVGDEHLAFSVLLLFFILLSSLPVMNMLVGSNEPMEAFAAAPTRSNEPMDHASPAPFDAPGHRPPLAEDDDHQLQRDHPSYASSLEPKSVANSECDGRAATAISACEKLGSGTNTTNEMFSIELIRPSESHRFSAQCRASDVIDKWQKAYSRACSVEAWKLQLVSAGCLLAESRTLSHYNINKSTQIHVQHCA
mmetsp:Transcript_43539/g.72318  ORF Transcript_43539/g.72318 Transcript_43539/m.72318 type:complete len:655 (-) Transcript_43539:128-2092(-)